MPIIALLLAAQPASTPVPACRAAQLRLSVDGRDGDFNGMSHAGTELSIRNRGPACLLPALPRIALRDARGRVLPAVRQAPVGMHPGPVMIPVRLATGDRATADLRWVSGAVFPHNRSLRAASVTVNIGGATLHTALPAMLWGQAGKPVTFDQTPLRATNSGSDASAAGATGASKFDTVTPTRRMPVSGG